MRRAVSIAAAVGAAGLASWLLWPAPVPVQQRTQAPAAAATIARIQPRPLRPAPATSLPLTDEERDFTTRLRERFALHIADKHAQIRLIEQVLAYLEAHAMAHDLNRAYALLREMFPDLADALFAKLQGLLTYDEWLAQTRNDIAQLPPDERRARLWEARREIFGDDAAEIWAGELRTEQLRTSLQALDAQPQLTTQEKLDRYVDAIHETYGDRAPELIERSSTELLDQFVGLESVQQDLAAMPSDQRRDALREIRGAMGLDSAAQQRWDTLDRARDQAWDVGQQYMRERPLVAGDRLNQLQDRLFGAEAESIRAEEASGFFRFGHPRRIGRE